MNKIRNLSIALSIIMLLMGCTGGMPATPAILIEPALAFTPSSPAETASPTILPTSRVKPTRRPALPTRTPSPAPMLTPTLNETERQAYIEAFLRTNGNCRLPCFFGITPGKTSWSEVRSLLSYLGKESRYPSIYPEYQVEKYHYQYEFDRQSPVSLYGIGVYVNNDEITMLTAGIREITDADIKQQYSFRNVLETLGKPTEVFIDLTGFGALGPEEKTLYQMTLFYDVEEFWLVAQYYGMSIQQGDVYRFCPTDLHQGVSDARVDDSVRFYIQSGSPRYTENDLLNMGRGGGPLLRGYRFAEATENDLEDLYTQVVETNEDVCYFTPRELWDFWK